MSAAAMNHNIDVCPDLETIAAFLDARLDGNDREAVAAHLSSCERCYFIFSEAAQVRPVDEPVVVPMWKRPAVRWAAAGLAAAATLVLAARLSPVNRSRDAALVEALVTAVGTERLIQPRLTGGFAYGPVRGPVRSGRPAAAAMSPDVRIAAARIEKDTTSQYSAAAFHVRGIAALVSGDVDRAVAALEAAAGERSHDARILNDLAAAYMVRGERTGDKEDLSKALATINKALELDRVLAEAQFNRAYTLERLSLTVEARDAWQNYLSLDARSPWANEARDRLRVLTQ